MDRARWIFWGVVLSALILICIPSTILWRAVSRYRMLAAGMNMIPLRSTRSYILPHRAASPIQKPSLEFAQFRIKAPRARNVELVGDFNNWRPGTISLAKRGNGLWDISLPLPKGRYRYLFIVDGLRQPDATNGLGEYMNGSPVSVKEVTGNE